MAAPVVAAAVFAPVAGGVTEAAGGPPARASGERLGTTPPGPADAVAGAPAGAAAAAFGGGGRGEARPLPVRAGSGVGAAVASVLGG